MDAAFEAEHQAPKDGADSNEGINFQSVSDAIEKFTSLKKDAGDAIKNIGDYEEAEHAYQGAIDAGRKGDMSEAIKQGAVVIKWLEDNAKQLRKFEK